MLSIQKIVVGGLDVTPEGTDAGGKDAIYNVIRGALGNDVIVDTDGRLHIVDSFSGDVYENEHTMTTDAKYRFETDEKKLKSGVILVSTKDALVGDDTNQRYPKSAGSTLSIESADLSKLYFKNATAGQNTKINIIGVLL
jgi:hypothetical protein